jgi:hypothetical protein
MLIPKWDAPQDRGMFTVPDDFNAPLPEDILVAFEGGAE